MAASDLLDIWNSAVLNFGSNASIASLSEQSAEAAACALRYPSIVRTILRDTDWNCVRRRVALTEAVAGAVWPPSWCYMYLYPADCLHVRGFDLGIPIAKFPNWAMVEYEVANDAIAGSTILMNITDPIMIYTSFTLDLVNGTYESKFDGALREAIGWALGAAIAGPLGAPRTTVADIRTQARVMLDAARFANAVESTPNTMDVPQAESLEVRGYCGPDTYSWQRGWPY